MWLFSGRMEVRMRKTSAVTSAKIQDKKNPKWSSGDSLYLLGFNLTIWACAKMVAPIVDMIGIPNVAQYVVLVFGDTSVCN